MVLRTIIWKRMSRFVRRTTPSVSTRMYSSTLVKTTSKTVSTLTEVMDENVIFVLVCQQTLYLGALCLILGLHPSQA